ncbi:PREDICTED: uncharacterized protein LOC109230376 [Nicotiana attenuata]|uniref:uncharacterized protein LOC109230376 n=1 Tax=Nicotiana attenuata TaxID=49451 RepID=UPI00090512C2|nr:PREDICTED: uncharacterized protein LOC109230376 [Nicotiana attenuata]
MSKFLANLNVAEGCKLLRECYLDAAKGLGKLKPNLYPALLKEFLSDIQRACYERFILDIASTYEGYEFYLPAFVNFRGRIYRAGALHFHERDLARSLIVFSKRIVYDAKMANPSHSTEYDEKVKTMLYASASFHYQKFDTYSAAERWYHEQRFESIGRIIEYAPTARDPFQFLSKALIIQRLDSRVSEWQLHITQDASASAYQIISYFLLDFEIANCTNLIPTKGDKEPPQKKIGINDVYDFFVSEIKKSLIEECKTFEDPRLIRTHVCEELDRKIVKSLLMSLIYGKTAYSMADDLYQHYSSIYLKKTECLKLSSHIEKFFKSRFPHIVNLMTLIRSVGWLASAMGRPVYYSTPVFTTVQDYMKSEAIKIWIYDRPSKKRRQVTLRIPTNLRDLKKTTSAIFANFIHQKDANIAFYMIRNAKLRGIPIYTVHDNFITTPDFAPLMGGFYIDVLEKGPHPMEFINTFIMQNLAGDKYYDHARVELCKWELIHVDEMYILLGEIDLPELYKKRRKFWDSRLQVLVDSYYSYIQSIRYLDYRDKDKCIRDCEDSGYFIRLERFKKQLGKWKDYIHTYCIHL